jgi:hypothetical protein
MAAAIAQRPLRASGLRDVTTMADRRVSLLYSPQTHLNRSSFRLAHNNARVSPGRSKRNGERVVAYLLQFVQCALSDTALFEVILGRIHHLLDDLLVDVALFTSS